MIGMVGGVLLTPPSHQQTTTTTPKSPNYKPTSSNNEKSTLNSSNKYTNSKTNTPTNTNTTTNTKSKFLLRPLPPQKIRTGTLSITLRIMTMRSPCCLIERVFLIYFPSYLIVSFGWITLYWIYLAFVSYFGCLNFFYHVWVFPIFCKK